MVNIDTVYQRVLAFLNKEQRGYLTPQEFNLFAEQAQLEIFEQYFYDLNQFERVKDNDEKFSDIIHNINEKISIFKAYISLTSGGYITDTDFYRLGTVLSGTIELEEVKHDELLYMKRSALVANFFQSMADSGVYTRDSFRKITTFPSYTSLNAWIVRKPTKPVWGYFVVGDKALHDTSVGETTHFQLHASEESELVYKILKFAGASISKPEVVQMASAQEQIQIQQEKQ